MPLVDPQSALIELRGERSSASILGAMAVLGLIAYTLYHFGVLGWAVGLSSRLVRWAIRSGFRAWEATLGWASWWVLLLAGLGLLVVGFLLVGYAPAVGVAVAAAALYVGVTTCLAYMFIDIERYEVERGYKAVHNPLRGQEPAPHLARYGHQVGVLMLVAATVATVGGFALLNQGLYEAGRDDWYRVNEAGVGTVDFLAYSLLNLLRVVDVLDLARSKHLLDAAYVRPGRWPASVLIVLFRSFFTLVLLQQIFASIRQGRLLVETVADFWSPHEPIRERARNALPQYGAAVIEPLLVSLRAAPALTKEQRDHLPPVLAAIGPSTAAALARHLGDSHEHVRAICAATLGRLNAVDALPALAAMTGDPSDHVRLALAEGLGEMAAAAGDADRPAPVRRRRPRRGRWFRRTAGVAVVRDPLPVVLAALRELLRDENPAVRAQAVAAVARAGAAADEAAALLATRLGDTDEAVRCRAADALACVGLTGPEGREALAAALGDPSAAVRAAAARALANHGPAAAAAVPKLVPLLQDHDEAVRTAAADAIARAGPLDASATATLVRGLESPDNVVRAQTAEALGAVGAPADEAAEALAGVLRDANDAVRAKAAGALGRIGEPAADVAVPSLVRALRDKDSLVSASAAEALGAMGDAAGEAVPALVRALAHVNAHVRANAARALGRLGADAGRVRDALERAAADGDGGVRAAAVRSVGRCGTPAKRFLVVVRAALADADPEVREAAVDALGAADRPAAEIERLVLPLLGDSNDGVKLRAIRVLTRRGDPSAALVAGLGRLMTDDDSPAVQVEAALGLGRLGRAAAAAGPALLRAGRTGDASVREQALKALAVIQPPEAPEAFTIGLKDPAARVRLVASAGWVNAATVPAESVAALVDALKDPAARVRANAAHALERLDRLPAEAVPLLAECVRDPDDGLRRSAAGALRRAPAGTTAEVMAAALGDPNVRVRLIAAGAVLAADPAHTVAREVVEAARSDPSRRVRAAAEELLSSVPEVSEPAPALVAVDPAVVGVG